MKVIKAFPPNFLEVAKVFPVKGKPGILYSWGDKLYNPSGVKVTSWIMAHEQEHGFRQLAKGVDEWWTDYLIFPSFRLDEELRAHRAEWQTYKHHMQMVGNAAGYLDLVAKRLSSPLYGSLISFDEAKKRIAA